MPVGDDSQVQAALANFKSLPSGVASYGIEAPPFSNGSQGQMVYFSNETTSLFCASAFKVFVLAAYLYYAEREELSNQPPQGKYSSLLDAALAESLTVSDHTLDSTVFGGVTGTTSASAIQPRPALISSTHIGV